MDKFADMNWSFSELIAAGEGDAKIARYISWIVCTYATPAAGNPRQRVIKGRPSRSSLDFYGNF